MTVPYDNYGKGFWNRARKDEVSYREKLGRIDFTIKKASAVSKVEERKGVKLRITYK